MRIFNDCIDHEVGNTKKEQIDAIIQAIDRLHTEGKIKDIMIIARTTEAELSPRGLPLNIKSGLTVDDEYEATLFMKFAVDMLFDRMKHIAVKDYIKNHEKEIKEIMRNAIEELRAKGG